MQQNIQHMSYFDGNSTFSLITETETTLAMDVPILAQSHFVYKIGQSLQCHFLLINTILMIFYDRWLILSKGNCNVSAYWHGHSLI